MLDKTLPVALLLPASALTLAVVRQEGQRARSAGEIPDPAIPKFPDLWYLFYCN